MEIWIPAAITADDLVAECRSIDAVLAAWGGPDRETPGGPRPAPRRSGGYERIPHYSIRVRCLPSGPFEPVSEQSEVPLAVRYADRSRIDRLESTVIADCFVEPSPADQPLTVWCSMKPAFAGPAPWHAEAGEAVDAYLARHRPQSRRFGEILGSTRFDGRVDRLRSYWDTRLQDSDSSWPRDDDPILAVSIDPDGGNPGEFRLIEKAGGPDKPFEPERLPI